jgi:hypothetical protein
MSANNNPYLPSNKALLNIIKYGSSNEKFEIGGNVSLTV